jgi:hypothetical protein
VYGVSTGISRKFCLFVRVGLSGNDPRLIPLYIVISSVEPVRHSGFTLINHNTLWSRPEAAPLELGANLVDLAPVPIFDEERHHTVKLKYFDGQVVTARTTETAWFARIEEPNGWTSGSSDFSGV